jgi:hypothetical protein
VVHPPGNSDQHKPERVDPSLRFQNPLSRPRIRSIEPPHLHTDPVFGPYGISPDMPPCARPWTPIPRPKPAIAPPEAGWPRWWRWANDLQTPLEWKARILMELASYVYPKTYRCLKKRSEINKLCNILWTAAIQKRGRRLVPRAGGLRFGRWCI